MGEEDAVKAKVSEEDVKEFLKIIKKSEYNVVEQLNKMPAQISILGLLKVSETHRDALLKVLNETHVASSITPESLENLVGQVLATNVITFTDDELPPEGSGHNRALHITVKCKDMIVARVLIDNGSALNVCLLITTEKLGIEKAALRPCNTVIKAFDGSKRKVLGEIDLPVEIGPYTFEVTFQVLDIPTAYNFMLGRPWVHTAGAVPSSLHQSIKYIVDNHLVTVQAEEVFIPPLPGHPLHRRKKGSGS